MCVCVWSWGDPSFDVKNVQIKTPAKKETKKTDRGDISATYLAMRILAWDLPVSCWAPASEIQLDPSSQEHCCCGFTLQIRSCKHRDLKTVPERNLSEVKISNIVRVVGDMNFLMCLFDGHQNNMKTAGICSNQRHPSSILASTTR